MGSKGGCVNTVGRTLSKIICIGLVSLGLHGLVSATDSPLNVIQTTMQRVVAILQDPAYQDPEQSEERIKKVRELALPQFDSREIAKRTLGIHWRDRTEEEREEFIKLFIDLVEKAYSSTLDRYRGDTEFFFDREHIDGTYAEVDSRITVPSLNKTFSLNYRLHLVDGRWLIYDVVIENVSMVRNYRTQFNRIINKSSYESLVQSIQSKLKQLAASPS